MAEQPQPQIPQSLPWCQYFGTTSGFELENLLRVALVEAKPFYFRTFVMKSSLEYPYLFQIVLPVT